MPADVDTWIDQIDRALDRLKHDNFDRGRTGEDHVLSAARTALLKLGRKAKGMRP